MQTHFVDILLPLALPKPYTYRARQDQVEFLEIGKRAVVQLGKTKLYAGIILNIHHHVPKVEAKYLEGILDDAPIVNQSQLEHWQWLSEYYMCTLGEVMAAALPGGLKLQSETRIILDDAYQGDGSELDDREFLIFEALQRSEILKIEEIIEILQLKVVHPIVKGMLEKGIIRTLENLKDKYKPKEVAYLHIHPNNSSEAQLESVMKQLEKSPKQLELLLRYIQHSKYFTAKPLEVKKDYLMRVYSIAASSLKALVDKEIFEIYYKVEGRLADGDYSKREFKLSDYQEEKFEELKTSFESNPVVLLHGVTSAGKTEIYIKLIEIYLAKKKQILFLLPEIALTTQLIERLKLSFGNLVGVYHSKFNENERVEVWNEVLKGKNGKYQLIIGARSAMFLPYADLGLIIVDEEHETSFKQQDPAPRYNARDAAIVLASIHNAKTLLGSATPALESIYNAAHGKYGMVTMDKRFGDVAMPEIFTVDMKTAKKKKQIQSHFSTFLIEHMQEALANNEQIILFQNRRGFSPFVQCKICANVPRCINCDISLTYHKGQNQLNCHYCGYHEKMHHNCMACNSSHMELIGFGTEKIEDELSIIFPDIKIQRLDLDTTRSKNAYQKILSDFEERNIHVLVGTQMVSKGLDFENVSLVGILDADSIINYPEFRAQERAFQLMAQVAGRAGRRQKKGKVIIQTSDPYKNVIQQVIANDYKAMAKEQMFERKRFHYPPYFKLIKLTLKSTDKDFVDKASVTLAASLRKSLGNRVNGPNWPLIARINNYYHKNILIKIEKEASTKKVKSLISEIIDDFYKSEKGTNLRINTNVDP